MKKVLCIVLVVVFVSVFAGCTQKSQTDNGHNITHSTADTVEATQAQQLSEEVFLKFTSEFVYATGVGGWGETFLVNPDGTFTGEYHDSDKGDFGPEYMKGVIFKSDYTGKFKDIERVNDYTYILEYNALNYEVEPGTEKIADDFKYSYGYSRGLQNTNKVYLYTPSARVSDLPEYYQDWVVDFYQKQPQDTLGFYGIYNEQTQACFVSDNM